MLLLLPFVLNHERGSENIVTFCWTSWPCRTTVLLKPYQRERSIHVELKAMTSQIHCKIQNIFYSYSAGLKNELSTMLTLFQNCIFTRIIFIYIRFQIFHLVFIFQLISTVRPLLSYFVLAKFLTANIPTLPNFVSLNFFKPLIRFCRMISGTPVDNNESLKT